MLTDKFLVTIHGAAPALVLDEGVVKTHVLRHWCAADGAARHERAWDAHVFLLGSHAADDLFIVVGFLAAGNAALEQAEITLSVEEPRFVKTCALKAVVHIGGDDKIILVGDEIFQHVVGGVRDVAVAVEHEVTAPERPFFFEAVELVEAGAVKIGEAIFGDEIREILSEARSGHDEPGCSGKSGAGTDEHGVGVVEGFAQLGDLVGE